VPYKNREDKNRNGRKYWITKEGKRRRADYAKNPDAHYWRSILKRFGLSKERYEALHALGCWLCGDPFPPANDRYQVHVDHDHETNEVRGLTHGACNSLIGLAKENFILLRRIANALEARCPFNNETIKTKL
jgi:hypothetical protein